MIPVIVLNLAHSSTRRAQIAARLDELSIGYRFFDAIDGWQLSTSERELLAPQSALLFDRSLTPGEVGCAATHLAAIREIAGSSSDFVCTMEDDAILSDDVPFFLEQQILRSLPPFDILRFVSDPARWKMPAWKIAESHGRGVYAMSRPGWGLQGQVFSRDGACKIASTICCIRAPIDFALFHDCHVSNLRILEIRPGVVKHDTKLLHPELMALSVIGDRPAAEKNRISEIERLRLRYWRWRRKSMAARAFIRIWGVRGLSRILLRWPPGAYFR